jgi:hypothetical protein
MIALFSSEYDAESSPLRICGIRLTAFVGVPVGDAPLISTKRKGLSLFHLYYYRCGIRSPSATIDRAFLVVRHGVFKIEYCS